MTWLALSLSSLWLIQTALFHQLKVLSFSSGGGGGGGGGGGVERYVLTLKHLEEGIFITLATPNLRDSQVSYGKLLLTGVCPDIHRVVRFLQIFQGKKERSSKRNTTPSNFHPKRFQIAAPDIRYSNIWPCRQNR